MRLAPRMHNLGLEPTSGVATRARLLESTGRSVVHLERDDPGFETPAHVRAAAKAALDDRHGGHTPVEGLPELREAIAHEVSTSRGVKIDPSCCIVTPSARAALWCAVQAVLGDGDEALVPDPGHPVYASLTTLAGAQVVAVPLREANGFRVDIDELHTLLTDRTRVLFIGSPGNPTGSLATKDDLARLAAIARKHDLVVIADEATSRFVYGATHVSILRYPAMAERTVLIAGFSKTYALTSWRLGFAVVPGALRPAFDRLLLDTVGPAPSFAQHGALAALAGPQEGVAAMVDELASRRDLLVEGLASLPGLRCPIPEGAFWAFPDISATGRPAGDVADLLLYDAGVAVLPGTAFGTVGADHLRLSFANSRQAITRAIELMRPVFTSLSKHT